MRVMLGGETFFPLLCLMENHDDARRRLLLAGVLAGVGAAATFLSAVLLWAVFEGG
jgi:hypothetical protein